jgi:phosphoglycerate kinase
MRTLSIRDLPRGELRGKRVVVRVDYNVPLDDRQQVTDDTRIRATLPTLRLLAEAGARVVLLSHLGRPKGRPNPEMSLRPVAARLAELSGLEVHFVGATVGEQAESATRELAEGAVLLLENTRFDEREEANDPELSAAMARLGDVYVNDAFGAAHRAHASTAGIAEVMRGDGRPAAAGLLLDLELEYLGRALEAPARPFVAILGGAKISGKIDVVEALLPRTDRILIGGAMANTFFRAQGHATGRSLVEDDRIDMARDLMRRGGEKLMLPVDAVVADEVAAGQPTRVVMIDAVPDQARIVDVGPRTAELYAAEIAAAKTVLWNGPMGVFEIAEFSQGTVAVARALADATARGTTTIVGGGDSAAAVAELGLADAMSHISTGGGASLEFLEGRVLPGVAALSPAAEASA